MEGRRLKSKHTATKTVDNVEGRQFVDGIGRLDFDGIGRLDFEGYGQNLHEDLHASTEIVIREGTATLKLLASEEAFVAGQEVCWD
jgi:hypothetical protein